jgi:hypothetical protein
VGWLAKGEGLAREGTVTGFTDKEVAAELERRRNAQRASELELKRSTRAHQESQNDMTCIHCGKGFRSHTSSAAEHGICNDCLHAD